MLGTLLKESQRENITLQSSNNQNNVHILAPEMNRISTNMLLRHMRQVDMKAKNSITWEMGLGNFTTKKEVFIKGSGKIILCMGKVISIILMESLLMKETGGWISSMGMAKFTIKNSFSWKKCMILPILQTSISTGHPIKENLTQIGGMGRVESSYRMDKYL